MGERTQVILLTGFLGSGKTTLLNRIISGWSSPARLMVLMNEFGEIGVDGRLIQRDDLQVLEINKGSIFCACVKTDFIKGLLEIHQRYQPDLLIIEATGAANPADLERSLNLSVFNGRFELKDKVCILDAPNLADAHDTFICVEKQIRAASVVLINKTDLASPESLEEAREIARGCAPDARIIETTYTSAPFEAIFRTEIPAESACSTAAPVIASAREIEQALNQAMAGELLNLSPPDRLMSAVYLWTGRDVEAFRRAVALLPGDMIRGKGFLAFEDDLYLFNLTFGQTELTRFSASRPLDDLVNKIIFIGSPEAMDRLDAAPTAEHFLIPASVHSPAGIPG